MPLTSPIRPFDTIGLAEFREAKSVTRLSGYLAGTLRGGKYVQALEEEWAGRMGMVHAIATNSATSGLLAACVSCAPEWEHQDIAVPCFTMSATAATPRIASPGNYLSFMDCDFETYCSTPLHCPKSRIGMIVVTNLFGQAAPLTQWRKFADDTGIMLIEDAAQSPFAETPDGKLAGTVGDVGVFSLNVHKHLQVGEGGIIVTNNDYFAEEMRGFINHGECLGQPRPGLNLRMTEIAAAMALVQLEKADEIIASRIELAHELSDMVKDFLVPPTEEGKHVFYHWAVRVSNRDAICDYLQSEGIPVKKGYVQPLYHIPVFSDWDRPCPVAEKAHDELMIFEICSWNPTKRQLKEMRDIFRRAYEQCN